MALPKSALRKSIVPGTWILVRWDDAPDSVELVVERPMWGKGDIDIPTMSTKTCGLVIDRQIVAVLGNVKPPRIPRIHA
jgi:hypothetical protein